MKKIAVIATIGFALFSCKSEKKADDKIEELTDVVKTGPAKTEGKSDEMNWDEIPELKNISAFVGVYAAVGVPSRPCEWLHQQPQLQSGHVYQGLSVLRAVGGLNT